MMKKIIIILMIIIIIKTKLYVDEKGKDQGNDCKDIKTPCFTLQKAINMQTKEGEEIITTKEYEEINVIEKSVSILSTNSNKTKIYSLLNLQNVVLITKNNITITLENININLYFIEDCKQINKTRL
jgi:hypothetical protein